MKLPNCDPEGNFFWWQIKITDISTAMSRGSENQKNIPQPSVTQSSFTKQSRLLTEHTGKVTGDKCGDVASEGQMFSVAGLWFC